MADTVLGENAVELPTGTTAERPASPVAGMLRYNTSLGYVEYYNGSAWVEFKTT